MTSTILGTRKQGDGAAEVLAHRFHVPVLKLNSSNSHKNHPKEVEHIQGVVSDGDQRVGQATAFAGAGREIVHAHPAVIPSAPRHAAR